LKGPTHAVEESCTHNNNPQTNPDFEISNPTPTHLAQEIALMINLQFPHNAFKNHTYRLEFWKKKKQRPQKMNLPLQLTKCERQIQK
jgi:hypothetical protein